MFSSFRMSLLFCVGLQFSFASFGTMFPGAERFGMLLFIKEYKFAHVHLQEENFSKEKLLAIITTPEIMALLRKESNNPDVQAMMNFFYEQLSQHQVQIDEFVARIDNVLEQIEIKDGRFQELKETIKKPFRAIRDLFKPKEPLTESSPNH